jgi:hypothetical protein
VSRPASAGTHEDSTLAGLTDRPANRWSHRVAVALLVLFVLAGSAGLLGPRTAAVSASAGDYDLAVTYPSVTRAGLATPLHLEVTREGGFDGPVQLALCDTWFDQVDFQSWYPTPSSEAGGADRLVYEFDPPPGDTLEVSLDAKEQPGSLWGSRDCTVAVLEEDAVVTSVSFTTRRMP